MFWLVSLNFSIAQMHHFLLGSNFPKLPGINNTQEKTELLQQRDASYSMTRRWTGQYQGVLINSDEHNDS